MVLYSGRNCQSYLAQIMSIPEEIFRSYDIRGKHELLSEELAKKIGLALVQITSAKRVVVGRDMRPTSPELASAAILAMREAGIDVIDIGMCSTSLFNFAVTKEDVDVGLMVTASHNPPEYNGFKMSTSDGLPITGTKMLEVVKNIDEMKSDTLGSLEQKNIVDTYIDFCFSEVGDFPQRKLKVVVDTGNGMGSVTLNTLFERMPWIEMIPMYFEPDGRFPNHEANPAKEETLEDLKALVKAEGADLGIALDGDADRVVFVDENGASDNGYISLAMQAEYLMKNGGLGSIVYSPNATWILRDVIEQNNGSVASSKVGRTNVILKCREVNALMGGEYSGHFFYPASSYLETVDFTILLILSILSSSESSYSEIMSPYRVYASAGEINLHVEKKDEMITAFYNDYEKTALDIDDLDGYRFEFEDWWFNVRKSSTEPILRFTIEAVDEDVLAEKKQQILNKIESLNATL